MKGCLENLFTNDTSLDPKPLPLFSSVMGPKCQIVSLSGPGPTLLVF